MKYKKRTLKSGLRIVTAPQPGSTAVTVLVVVETGSNYESLKENGISHFLEHMCFKGTENRPTALAISHELDSIGASYNAFTAEEMTGYYAKAHPKHFDKILDVVSDIYLNQVFSETEITKESGVILEELNMYNDLPQRKVAEDLVRLMYGDQPAGRTVIGAKENIKNFQRRDFVKYKNKHYVAEGTIVFIAGNFDEKEAVKKISKCFTNISTAGKINKTKIKERQEKPKLVIRTKKTDQTHIMIGVRTFSANDKDVYTLNVLATILGQGMSSRLFQKVREDLGAAYYVGSPVYFFTDHGILAIKTGLDSRRYKEVLRAILEECVKLKDEQVSVAELKKAKEYIIGSMYLSLETSDSLAEFYAEQEILNKKLELPSQVAKKIKQVTVNDIQRVAKRVFIDKNLDLAVVGPKSEEKQLRKILTFS